MYAINGWDDNNNNMHHGTMYCENKYDISCDYCNSDYDNDNNINNTEHHKTTSIDNINYIDTHSISTSKQDNNNKSWIHIQYQHQKRKFKIYKIYHIQIFFF